MLASIKKNVYPYYPKTDSKGIFLSGFDTKGELIASSGVLYTDKHLEHSIETIYNGQYLEYENTFDIIACDIVTDVIHETDMQKIIATNLKEFGLFIATINNNISAVLLPNTVGIVDVKQAIHVMKQKHAGLDGQIHVYIFKTHRILCPKKDA